ncbi:MAG: hypothetical protein SNJ64_06530 [Endomicrobiia bacterium]
MKEFILEFQNYVNNVVNCVLKGIIAKTGLDPNNLKLSSKIKIVKDKNLLIKSLYDTLSPYLTDLKDILKTKIPPEKLYQPIKIKGKWILNPETGRPLTYKQWQDIVKSIMNYLGYTFNNLDVEFGVKSFVLATMIKKMTEEGLNTETIKSMSYEDIKNKFFNGKDLPVDKISYEKQIGKLDKYSQQVIDYSIDNAGKYLSIPYGEVANQVVKIVRNQITFAIQNKLTNQELASNLYHISKKEKINNPYSQDTYEAFTRDWRRIATTETSLALNNGIIANYSDEIKKGKLQYLVTDLHQLQTIRWLPYW